VRSPAERDEQTITIATALAIFVGVWAAGALIGVLFADVIEVSGRLADGLGAGLLAVACTCALSYLFRHRRGAAR
jgi:polyferredoxin